MDGEIRELQHALARKGLTDYRVVDVNKLKRQILVLTRPYHSPPCRYLCDSCRILVDRTKKIEELFKAYDA